ncbi:MAG: hypothetical protein RL322_2779 [Pseudomonadota bacterium]|jgi:tight adherence protein B
MDGHAAVRVLGGARNVIPIDSQVWPLEVLGALFVTGAGFALLVTITLGAVVRRYRRGLAADLDKGLRDVLPQFSANRLMAVCLAGSAAIAALAAVLTGSLALAFGLALVAVLTPTVSARWVRKRRRDRFRSQLPDLMMLMAGSLRAGAGLNLALSRVAAAVPAPASRELDVLLQSVRMGTPLYQSLFALERRMPFEEVTLWATALRIGADSGAGMAAVLESLSDSMRRKLVLEQKVQALTAQGRLQAWVMSLLPVIVLVLLRWVDPHAFMTLVHTAGGRWLLCIVAVSQLLGFLHIRRIVHIEV